MSLDGDLVVGELRIGGRYRDFALRLPRVLPAERLMPLVLVLHGHQWNVTGHIMREWTTFDRQADTWGFAVAYPDGLGGGWADGRGVTGADLAEVDDVTFLRTIIDWSAARYGTPADRAVVTGISNGAFMAHRLALEASDQVAVVAAVAGGLPAALLDTEPTHAVSALLIHGTADMVAPIGPGYSRRRGRRGERLGRTLSLHETAEHWRATNRCPPGADTTRTTEFSSRVTTDGGVGGTRVVAWTVFGGGHNWPGADVGDDWDEPTTQEFDGAEEICRFAAPLLAPAATRQL
ncbi:alpha/beta hydrolase-fold protein [Streptomyces sp. NBC_00285]|uniref:alpha/beta hydrolase family esterase n=1 Tax=Streptomyces sp. NBC_00285 TaxID=2975700 RepID=UPI002E2B0C6F|nr:alpha/beta hydrolase-fold protein [Streptomyces sp. NBC_00285]